MYVDVSWDVYVVNVMLCLIYVSSHLFVCAYGSVVCYFGCFGCGGEFCSYIVMMSSCVVYAS